MPAILPALASRQSVLLHRLRFTQGQRPFVLNPPGMAPKRKASATTASVAKGEVSAPKKTKKAEAKAVVPVTGAAESSDGKNLAFVIEAWYARGTACPWIQHVLEYPSEKS